MPTEPYDEQKIGPDDTIIRRINPNYHVIWDENRNCNRVSSAAYSKSSNPNGGMSVDIEALILAAQTDPVWFVTTPVYTGSVSFKAGGVRALDLQIGYDPIVDDPYVADNPHHGEVWTKTDTKRFSAAQREGLAKLATWYVEIPGVEIA